MKFVVFKGSFSRMMNVLRVLGDTMVTDFRFSLLVGVSIVNEFINFPSLLIEVVPPTEAPVNEMKTLWSSMILLFTFHSLADISLLSVVNFSWNFPLLRSRTTAELND